MKIDDIIGATIWGIVSSSEGGLEFELGDPYLDIREPTASRSILPNVQKLLARRRVWLRGRWHVWLREGSWLASNSGQSANSGDQLSITKPVFDDIAGQKVLQIIPKPHAGGGMEIEFQFDLGAKIEIFEKNGVNFGDGITFWTENGDGFAFLKEDLFLVE